MEGSGSLSDLPLERYIRMSNVCYKIVSYRDDLNLPPAQTPALPQGRREEGQARLEEVWVVGGVVMYLMLTVCGVVMVRWWTYHVVSVVLCITVSPGLMLTQNCTDWWTVELQHQWPGSSPGGAPEHGG